MKLKHTPEDGKTTDTHSLEELWICSQGGNGYIIQKYSTGSVKSHPNSNVILIGKTVLSFI